MYYIPIVECFSTLYLGPCFSLIPCDVSYEWRHIEWGVTRDKWRVSDERWVLWDLMSCVGYLFALLAFFFFPFFFVLWFELASNAGWDYSVLHSVVASWKSLPSMRTGNE